MLPHQLVQMPVQVQHDLEELTHVVHSPQSLRNPPKPDQRIPFTARNQNKGTGLV